MKIAFINKTNYYFNILINLYFSSGYYKNNITFEYDIDNDAYFIAFKDSDKTVLTFATIKYVF